MFGWWMVGLAVLLVLGYLVKRKLDRRKERKEHEKFAVKKKASRADADRRDILALAKGLNASSPAPEDEAPSLSSRPAEKSAAAPPAERTRRSSERAHGFDPDLPPQR